MIVSGLKKRVRAVNKAYVRKGALTEPKGKQKKKREERKRKGGGEGKKRGKGSRAIEKFSRHTDSGRSRSVCMRISPTTSNPSWSTPNPRVLIYSYWCCLNSAFADHRGLSPILTTPWQTTPEAHSQVPLYQIPT